MVFTYTFLAHIAFPKTTSGHDQMNLVHIGATLVYFLMRYSKGYKQKLNLVAFFWNFFSALALIAMNLMISQKKHKFGMKLYLVEIIFYLSIIWTVPLEILNNYLNND